MFIFKAILRSGSNITLSNNSIFKFLTVSKNLIITTKQILYQSFSAEKE